jgi:UrcA family protein
MGSHLLMGIVAAVAVATPLSSNAATPPTPSTVQELVVTPHLAGGAKVVSKTISYADLNVTQESGARKLLERIRSTARDLCADSGSVFGEEQRKACASDAVDRAVVDAAIPALTAAHPSKP